jgi:DNA-directed RNA polymerase specialized sigma24 family protein
VPDDTPEPLDPAISDLIRRKSRQLARRAGMTEQDRDDIQQHLLVHLLEHLPGIGARRAYPEAVVLTVLFRWAANFLRARRAAKRDHRRTRPLGGSGDVPVGGDRRSPAARGDDELADLAADVADVLADLPPEERELAELLMGQSKAGAARALGVPRTTLYAAIGRLRARFERAGLRAYL